MSKKRALITGINGMDGSHLADFVGLDTLLFVLETMYEEFGDPKYRPCPLLKKMVRSGNLGRKSGKGFYEYGK